MGCCGCSSYVSTITAGVFTLLDCILFLTFDILLIVFISGKSTLTANMTPYDLFVYGFNQDTKVIKTFTILLGCKIAIRVLWGISAIILLIGNAKEYRKFLYVWQYLTVARILFAIACSVYAIVSVVEDLKGLSSTGTLTITLANAAIFAELTLLVNSIDLGPIWWIILIALIIYVYKRGQEIQNKKTQMSNKWGNFDFPNGNSRNTVSALAHPVSLTQEPNPFMAAVAENDKKVATSSGANGGASGGASGGANPVSGEPIEPILKINEVVSIPRVTLSANKAPNVKANVQTFDNNAYEVRNRNASALAKRTSHLEYERDPNNMPKRTHSYNTAQNSEPVSKYHYSYDNRGFKQ